MARLFGKDIATLVNRNVTTAGGLQKGRLYHRTTRRNPTNPTATITTSTTHSFQGVFAKRVIRRENTLISEAVPVLSIMGASVSPVVEPEVGDRADLFDDRGNVESTFDLVELISRDPAGASYEFRTRE